MLLKKNRFKKGDVLKEEIQRNMYLTQKFITENL